MLIRLKFLECRQMSRHFGIGKPFTIATVISHTQRNEVVSHNTADITLVMQTLQRVIEKKFMFRVSHGTSNIKFLPPVKWVGRHVALRLRLTCLPIGYY